MWILKGRAYIQPRQHKKCTYLWIKKSHKTGSINAIVILYLGENNQLRHDEAPCKNKIHNSAIISDYPPNLTNTHSPHTQENFHCMTKNGKENTLIFRHEVIKPQILRNNLLWHMNLHTYKISL